MKNLIDSLGLSKIDDWTFIEELGGGKAATNLLYENDTKEKAVVKILIAPRNNSELENFQNEASALKQLNFLPRCYVPKLIKELTKQEPYPIYFYITEYIDGVELKKLFVKHRLPWGWEKSTELLCRISFALSQGSPLYVHRDLHPGNILILDNIEFDKYSSEYTEPGVRILDYGCSIDTVKRFISKSFFDDLYEDKFRHPGAISTWSPEFINAPHLVDNRHDSWSLGVLYYRLLKNEYPIHAESFGALLEGYKNLDQVFKKIELLGIHKALKKLLKHTLSADTKERLLTNEIFYFCSDILFKNLLDFDDAFIDMYIASGCSVSRCAMCFSYIGRKQSRCNGCGNICDEENLIPVLQRKG